MNQIQTHTETESPRHPDPRHPDPRHPDPRHPDPRHPDPRHPDPRHPEDVHPVNARYHGDNALPGIRFANLIIGFMGSWRFLILQTVVCAIWIALNVVAWFKHFDPYPFIFLNLAFSTQAAYAAPLILMAGNVASAKDRELWENDYTTNQKAYDKIEALERQIQVVAQQNHELLKLLSTPSERRESDEGKSDEGESDEGESDEGEGALDEPSCPDCAQAELASDSHLWLEFAVSIAIPAGANGAPTRECRSSIA